ncbi:MAG: hypothetical protein IPJ69_09730 [Deltaproteobacteria bacterium]|nr:MAG: hypothetical protein IPJ69_09730 [Deltaproteobacteria bacterium]
MKKGRLYIAVIFILILSGCTGGIIVPDATVSTAGPGEIGSLSYRARIGMASYDSATPLASASYQASVASSNSVLTTSIESTSYQIADPLLEAFLN